MIYMIYIHIYTYTKLNAILLSLIVLLPFFSFKRFSYVFDYMIF